MFFSTIMTADKFDSQSQLSPKIEVALLFVLSSHNDLPWNIRKFVHNELDTVNFTHNLKYVEPWSKSPWSHTDIMRLADGMVGCQVREYMLGHQVVKKGLVRCFLNVKLACLGSSTAVAVQPNIL